MFVVRYSTKETVVLGSSGPFPSVPCRLASEHGSPQLVSSASFMLQGSSDLGLHSHPGACDCKATELTLEVLISFKQKLTRFALFVSSF